MANSVNGLCLLGSTQANYLPYSLKTLFDSFIIITLDCSYDHHTNDVNFSAGKYSSHTLFALHPTYHEIKMDN